MTEQQIYAFYYDRLKWCGCYDPVAALRFMQKVLAAIAAKTEARQTRGDDRIHVAEAEAALAALVDPAVDGDAGALSLSYLYTLDAAGLLEHGSSIGSSWLSSEGEKLLEALAARSDVALEAALNSGYPDDDLPEIPPRCRHCGRPTATPGGSSS